MKNTILLILLFVFVSCANGGGLTLQEEDKDFSVVSGHLSNLNINAFCEDRFGHVWIGTDRGLNRATGKEFYQYISDISDESTINNNLVNDIMLDSSGRLWIATSSGPSYYTDKDDFHRVEVMASIGRKHSYRLVELKSGAILSKSAYHEVFCYDSSKDKFYPLNKEDGNVLKAETMMAGKGNELWTTDDDALYRIDVDTIRRYAKKETYPYPKANVYSSAVQDEYGTIWIYGSDDLVCFNTNYNTYHSPSDKLQSLLKEKRGGLEQIYIFDSLMILQFADECWFYYLDQDRLLDQSDEEVVYELPYYKPEIMFMDSNGNLWVGADGHGFEVCSRRKKIFNRNTDLFESLRGINVVSMDSDASDRIWMVTYDNRLISVDQKGKVLVYDDNYIKSITPSEVEIQLFQSIKVRQEDSTIWIKADNVIYCYEIKGSDLRFKDSYHFQRNVRAFRVGNDGFLYVGLSNGWLSIVNIEGKTISYKDIGLNTYIYHLYQLKDGDVLISSFHGPLVRYDHSEDKYETLDYRLQVGEMFHILSMYEDNDGIIWMTTRDYGLLKYDVDKGEFLRIKGTTCNTLADIRGNDEGMIWISSAHGLNLLSPEDGSILHFFNEMGLGGNQFNDHSSCVLSDGTVIFGGPHGITACHSIDSENERNVIPLLFENVRINGKKVVPAQDGIYTRHITENPSLYLKHDENNISVSFAALEYVRPRMVQYEYILEGYDQFSVALGNSNNAHYSSLPPGKYNLKVSCSLPLSEVSYAEMPIVIRPPVYKTKVAFILYFLMSALMLLFIYKSVKRRLLLKVQLEQSISEKEHERYINRMNMNFFADMAHEFRSPLTMIVGPLTQMRNEKSLDPESRRLVSMMKLSVDRMNKLVNQLLDFNKMDNGKLTLKVVRGYNITLCLSHILDLFSINAMRQGIKMDTYGLDVEYRIPLDPDKFESIIGNLLSNALKYAGNDGEKGVISVRLESDMTKVRVVIENNGRPFAEEELEKLFDRYYQIRQHANNCKQPGTGIGLNFAYKLAKHIHASLMAENLPDGKGVRFTLELPVSDSVFDIDDFVVEYTYKEEETASEADSVETDGKEKNHTILVVDDDIDIANYLSMLLSPYYNVISVHNTESANECLLSDAMPDVVLSDIIMPNGDGITFCRSIKSNMLTCHIPVILVTAKIGVSNEVEGLDSGADAYVTKPFDPIYMLALIRSMLKNRELVKGELVKSTEIDEVSHNLLSPQDKDFMTRLYGIMERELSNPELNIHEVSSEMCVSRTKLFYKTKSLTGMSPVHLFRAYRLNMAAKMLKESGCSIAEVAFQVGFNSPSYFTRAFKSQFGYLPKEMKK